MAGLGGAGGAGSITTGKKNTNYIINIYNAYSLECITSLKGHTDTVTDLIWSKGDKKLFSCGEDGLIYVYTTDSWEKKDIKLKTPNIKLSTMIYNEA